jgi:hypothetical protein
MTTETDPKRSRSFGRMALFAVVGGALGFGLSMLYTAFGST